MTKQERSAITDWAWAFIGGVIGNAIGMGIGVCTEYNRNLCELSDSGYKKSMEQHEPVGNGGALSAIMGDISPRRAQMYQRMQDAYESGVGEKALEDITDHRYKDIKERTQVKKGTRCVDDITFVPFGY